MRGFGVLVLASVAPAARAAITMTSGPACDGYSNCEITTFEECEAAAIEIGHTDSTANALDTPSKVSYCSINQGGGLRFNADSSMTTPNEFGNVLCMDCPLCTEDYCEETGTCDSARNACPIDTLEECETASAFVFHTDSTANAISKTGTVSGCSINNKGGLRFNSADTTKEQNARGGQRVLCKACNTCNDGDDFCTGRGQCTGNACVIQTEGQCNAAAADLGISDTISNVITDNGKVPGCSVNNNGGLRYNDDLTSTAVQSTFGGQVVVCENCANQV